MKSYFLTLVFSLIIFSSLANAQNHLRGYVILISLDGARWDYVNRNVTPTLDSIKKIGVWALSLMPAFPSKTFPNHLSIITGMYPQNHGIISNYIKNPNNNKIYKLSDTAEIRNPEWYLGEAFWETARRNGIITASHFWPGSEIRLNYKRPDYFLNYQHNMPYIERVDRVITWLKLPYSKRPRFITLYFDAPDTYGHKFGPNSKEVDSAMKYCDKILGILFSKIRELPLKDSVDIIIVSDHGMTETFEDKIINVKNILRDYEYESIDEGPIMFINPYDKKQTKEIYATLKKNENGFKAFIKNEVPGYFKFSDHPFIGDIILIAEPNYSLLNSKEDITIMKNYFSKGNHGYDNHNLDMHGIFLAFGPSFKSNYKTGTLLNIDIYPLLCKIFRISPRQNIDGKLERIEFILK